METIYQYAIRKIHEQIPYEILQETFNTQKRKGWGLRTPINMDATIEAQVIRASVLKDVLAMGGRETTIPLGGCVVQLMPSNKCVIQIPLSLTAGRNIIDCYRVNFFSSFSGSAGVGGGYGGISYANSSTFNLALNNIIDSVRPPDVTGSSRIEMVGPNTLLADLDGVIPYWMEAEVLLEKDSELSHISSASFDLFGRLCVTRAKATIYRTLWIRIDQGYVEGGRELGEFKNVVSEWRDMEEIYNDLLKQWKTKEVHEDRAEMEKLIRLAVGRFHV